VRTKQKLKAERLKPEIGQGVVGLTKAQMASVLQISVRTLNGMIARGEIAYWRIGRRVVRFRVEDAVEQMNATVLVPVADGRCE
jgi:excisionase family DNA binding protein